ncbi:MAG: cysteine desulfurase-like protein [Gammaproteobacteria bacterium]
MKDGDQDFFARRGEIPALARVHSGHKLAYLDGPAGTQVPQQVIDAIAHYYVNCNANAHGYFVTAQESDRIVADARTAMAVFLNAESDANISFGANMTTLCFSLSKGIARSLKPGDEILITRLDHEANRGPWLALRENDIEIREVDVLDNGTLDYEDFRRKISARTRLVAMGMSSNAFGTVNDVQRVREWTREADVWLLVDAVHYAPHFAIDVRALDVDFLLCSAYKFYGPHVGVLYARTGLLDRIQTDCLITQEQEAPFRIETGTLNHAAIAGVKAAVEYIATFGEGNDFRARLVTAMKRIATHEHTLAERLYDGLGDIAGVTVYGPDFESAHRAPTVSFTVEGKDPVETCKRLAEKGICAWDGHFYAITPLKALGLMEGGGVTRLGVSLYNTEDEIGRVLKTVAEIASGN